MPTDRPKGPPQGVELIWQPQTVQQYYSLLRKSENKETLEGSAGALHNLTACSWKVGLKNFVTVFPIPWHWFCSDNCSKIKRISVSCWAKSCFDGSHSQRTRSVIWWFPLWVSIKFVSMHAAVNFSLYIQFNYFVILFIVGHQDPRRHQKSPSHSTHRWFAKDRLWSNNSSSCHRSS